jgi:hypothetical protein
VSTAKSWDSSYEWQAVLTLSLAFGLVGLDRFILPPGIAPSIAGAIAQNSGIQYTLYFALGGQVVGLLLSLFLLETAPRRASRGGSVSELDSVPESG